MSDAVLGEGKVGVLKAATQRRWSSDVQEAVNWVLKMPMPAVVRRCGLRASTGYLAMELINAVLIEVRRDSVGAVSRS